MASEREKHIHERHETRAIPLIRERLSWIMVGYSALTAVATTRFSFLQRLSSHATTSLRRSGSGVDRFGLSLQLQARH